VPQSLCLACGSDPKKGTEKKLGAYIMKTCFQTTTISSGMFITAMAANPLAVRSTARTRASRLPRLLLLGFILLSHTRGMIQLAPRRRCSTSSLFTLPVFPTLQIAADPRTEGRGCRRGCVTSDLWIEPMDRTLKPPEVHALQVSLAKDSLGFTISWGQWALAGLVPGLIALLTTPAILYVLYPPEQKQTPDAPAAARKELEKLGASLSLRKWLLGPLRTSTAAVPGGACAVM